ncbi:cysteine desulfurase family protein [Maricaulis maris]|uniref:cysteine desulfurase family protein n=1 Tax=Maricaulis maris TaxID=74318 RepID=UPI0029211E10|nr:cysteine desulfurase IscS [Maricaulis maris]
MKNIYLDYNSTTPVSDGALKAMEPYWQGLFGNPHSGEHAYGWAGAEAVEASKAEIAERLHTGSDEVIFTSGATEANALAILGYAMGMRERGQRPRVLVGAAEHKSVFSAARQAEKLAGALVEVLPVEVHGRLKLQALEEALARGRAMVSVGVVNGEIGVIENLRDVYRLVAERDGMLHADAAQAAASINLSEIMNNADLISLSAHKCYGPKGIGALVGRWEVLDLLSPLLEGGGQQAGIRGGTVPTPLAVGFATAFAHSQDDIELRTSRLRGLSTRFFDQLQAVCPAVRKLGGENRHAGNLSVLLPGIDARELVGMMQPELAVSTGSACSSGAEAPSHVLAAIGLDMKAARSVVRVSVGDPTSVEDVDRAADIFARALSNYENGGI